MLNSVSIEHFSRTIGWFSLSIASHVLCPGLLRFEFLTIKRQTISHSHFHQNLKSQNFIDNIPKWNSSPPLSLLSCSPRLPWPRILESLVPAPIRMFLDILQSYIDISFFFMITDWIVATALEDILHVCMANTRNLAIVIPSLSVRTVLCDVLGLK